MHALPEQANNDAEQGSEAAPAEGWWGERIFLLLLALWLVALTFFLVNAKENVFMDEALTYFRACTPSSEFYEDIQQTLDDPSDYFQDLFSVEKPFRYDIVYRNETENVHPPLHYYVLHTICSLFPGRYSLLFAGAINALFAVGTLLALNAILRLLVDDARVRAVLCLLYALSPGVWNNLSYLRMYVMLSFWITMLTWLFLANEHGSLRFYRPLLFLTVYCGILTHHHFLIFLAGSSFTYLAILLHRKDGKTILRHVRIVLAASLCALASFPPMIGQILNSNRGYEAQQNIRDWQGFAPRIRWFAVHGGQDLFGALYRPAMLLLLACLLIVVASRFWNGPLETPSTPPGPDPDMQTPIASTPGTRTPTDCDLCMLIVPTGFFCTIVSVTASFMIERYLYAIYPLLLMSFGVLLHCAILALPSARRFAFPIVAVVAVLTTGSALRAASFPYLYRGDAERREALLPYAETDCLYLLQEDDYYPNLLSDYQELSMYGSVTIVSAADPGTPAAAFSDRDRLIVVTDDLINAHDSSLPEGIEEFCIRNGLPSHVSDLGAYSDFTHTYLCTRESADTP